jgi:hypothetical protein
MGHDLTHGVTEKEAQLIYQDQSGALNESVSDVYGSLVKQYHKGKQAAEDADWLIGEGIWADPGRGEALRSMKEPGTAFEGDSNQRTWTTSSTPSTITVACTSTPASRTRPSTSLPPRWADTPGRELVSYGMQRCVTPG